MVNMRLQAPSLIWAFSMLISVADFPAALFSSNTCKSSITRATWSSCLSFCINATIFCAISVSEDVPASSLAAFTPTTETCWIISSSLLQISFTNEWMMAVLPMPEFPIIRIALFSERSRHSNIVLVSLSLPTTIAPFLMVASIFRFSA